ncbi:MAG: hypothetical protein WCK29_02240 [archaeon]
MTNKANFNRLLENLFHPEGVTLEIAENNRIQLPVNYVWTPSGTYILHNYSPKELASLKINSPNFIPDKPYKYIPKARLSFDRSMSPNEFRENNLMVATFGDSGADTLADIARQFSQKPYIFGHQIGENHPSILSSLALDLPFVSGGLVVHANAYANSDGYIINHFKPEVYHFD